MTNSERRISRVRVAVAPPGVNAELPRHDWSIAVQFAQRLEATWGRRNSLFPYADAESIWNEHRESTRGRDLDITGLSYAALEVAPTQWPCPAPAAPLPNQAAQGRARLYEDGRFATADGRARFANVSYQPVAEPTEQRFPFALTTGRLRDQWHGMSRTGNVPRLFGQDPEPALQMHAQDMARRQLSEGELVYVTSRRGAIVLPVQASAEQAPSQVFIAMHWGSEYVGGQSAAGHPLAGVNVLTNPVYCPDSKQPEFKHSAVKVLKADLPWGLLAMAWLPADQVLRVQQKMREMLGEFAFATCVPFGQATALADSAQARVGLQLRAAHHQSVSETLLLHIEQLLQLQGDEIVRYADARRGQRRTMLMPAHQQDRLLEGFLLAGDTRAQSWIRQLLLQRLPAQSYGRALLVPGSQPQQPVHSSAKVVCSCLNVTDQAIEAHLHQCRGDAPTRLASLQAALRCGSNCGSCVPQLQRMTRQAIELSAV